MSHLAKKPVAELMEHPLLGTRQRRGGGLAELSKLCHKLGLFGRKLGGRHHVKTKTTVEVPRKVTPVPTGRSKKPSS